MQLDKIIESANAIVKNKKNTLSIVLIAHVLGPRGYNNAKQLNCAETEHFTVEEFNEIYQGIVNGGFFVEKIFFSELEFIEDVLKAPDKYSSALVFNLCRNGVGMNRKTVVPAICDLLGITYTSSGSGQCAIARNKWFFTTILTSNGISCPVSSLDLNTLSEQLPDTTYVISKPNNESASQGVSKDSIVPLHEVKNEKHILIQEYIDGYECEVPIFTSGGQCFAMPPVGISFSSGENLGILSYEDAIEDKYDFYSMSDILSPEVCRQIMDDAEKTFMLLGLEKYGRVDFRIDKNTHKHYVIDVSTTPYITQHSSFAYTLSKSGGKYTDIYTLIFAAALENKYFLKR